MHQLISIILKMKIHFSHSMSMKMLRGLRDFFFQLMGKKQQKGLLREMRENGKKINFIQELMKKYHELNFNIHFAEAVKCPQGENIHSNVNLAWHKRQKSKDGLSHSKLSNCQHFSSKQDCIPGEEEIGGQERKGFYSECWKRTLNKSKSVWPVTGE